MNSALPRRRAPSGPLLALLLWGGLVGGSVGGCDHVRYTEAFEPEVAVERVLIRVEAGEVEIEAAEVLRVERAIRAPRGSLELSHRVEGGQLILEAHCRGLLPCAVDTLVSLPPGIPVEVELGHGDLVADGVDRLQVGLRSGEVTLDGVARATVQVGEGSVTARLTTGARADLTVAEGDIDVTVQGGSWQIEATAADVRLSGIESSEDADGQLHLVAPSGEVRVRLPEPVARR